MKTLLLIIFLAFSASVSAQSFAGKTKHKPVTYQKKKDVRKVQRGYTVYTRTSSGVVKTGAKGHIGRPKPAGTLQSKSQREIKAMSRQNQRSWRMYDESK